MRVDWKEAPGYGELEIRGHAPGPGRGENLVCAALSALAYAAAGVAGELAEAGRLDSPPEITLTPGYGRIACRGDVTGLRAVGRTMERIAAGEWEW